MQQEAIEVGMRFFVEEAAQANMLTTYSTRSNGQVYC